MAQRPIDREEVADVVRRVLIDQLGVFTEQLTRDADLVVDLGAEDEDLADINHAIEREFNIEDFDAVELGDQVGDVIDAIVDVLTSVPAEGPGR